MGHGSGHAIHPERGAIVPHELLRALAGRSGVWSRHRAQGSRCRIGQHSTAQDCKAEADADAGRRDRRAASGRGDCAGRLEAGGKGCRACKPVSLGAGEGSSDVVRLWGEKGAKAEAVWDQGVSGSCGPNSARRWRWVAVVGLCAM